MDPQGLSPEQAKIVLDADFKNVLKKVGKGATLSNAERARIEALAAGSNDSTAYAKTIVELSHVLGVTRRTLTTWQKMDGAPQPYSNGMYPVADWREFIRTRGLKAGKGTPAGDTIETLRARKILAEVEERELRLAVRRGDYVRIADVREEWTTNVGQASAVLRAKFENELPAILGGLEPAEIQKKCREAIDEVMKVLNGEGEKDEEGE